MDVIAVPVKSLPTAKRRLASILTPAERAALTLAMLEDVLVACAAQPAWDVWVVSGSREALAAGTRHGARPVVEDGRSLLRAVRQAEGMLRGRAARLAVVLADLPLLTAGSLAGALRDRAPVVAAPAASDGGTNLLVRRPPSVIPARFGASSFARHRAEAHRAEVRFAEAPGPELGFDLDRPADLAALIASDSTCRARAACLDMGLAARLHVPA